MTAEDVVTIIYRQLKALTSIPIHKNSRPTGASGQYFVINCLGVNAGTPDQPAVINVNGYIPDIVDQNSGSEADSAGLKSMTALAMQLDDKMESNLSIYFKTQKIVQEAELKSHFTNVQFNVLILNN